MCLAPLFSLQLSYEKSHLAEKAANLLVVNSEGFFMGDFATFTKVPFGLAATKLRLSPGRPFLQ